MQFGSSRNSAMKTVNVRNRGSSWIVGDPDTGRFANPQIVGVKSVVPYRQCSAGKTLGGIDGAGRSIVDRAICSEPLARLYGD